MTHLQLAEQIAWKAHGGQLRRDGVTSYYEHLEAVVRRLGDESEEVRAVAWLHDVLEDTPWTVDVLRVAGIMPCVVEAVRVLTRHKYDSYADYISQISQHPVARKVKIAGILSNLSDTPTERQIVKYARALLILLDVDKQSD